MDLPRLIRQIETQNKLSELTVNGLHVWLAIRKHIYPKLTGGIFGFAPPKRAKLLKLLKMVFYGLPHWFRRYRYWFISSSTTRKPVGHYYRDIYCDHIAQTLPDSWIIEYTLDGHHPVSLLPFRNISSMLGPVLLEKLLGQFCVKQTEIKAISAEIAKTFTNHKLDGVDFTHAIRKMIGQYRFMRMLLRVKRPPEAVFIVSAYSYYGYVKAFKERSIPVIELQHGVIALSHPGYTLYGTYPDGYFPDYILSFGLNELQTIAPPNSLAGYTTVLPTGSYTIDHHLSSFSAVPAISKLIKSYNLSFCVSLQDCEIGQKLIDWLIEIANSHPQYLFLLKPRRTSIRHYTDTYTFPSNCRFIDTLNIYDAILHCQYHITAYSTTALEAPALGRQNILFNINGKARSYYAALLDEGTTTVYLDSPGSFRETLQRLPSLNPDEIQQAVSNVFVPNYRKNLKQNLRKILGSSYTQIP